MILKVGNSSAISRAFTKYKLPETGNIYKIGFTQFSVMNNVSGKTKRSFLSMIQSGIFYTVIVDLNWKTFVYFTTKFQSGFYRQK